MQIYKQGAKVDGLQPAGFLKAANATFIGPEPADVIRLDGGNLSGPWAIGVWGVETGEFELAYDVAEFITILEGRAIVSQGSKSAELKAGDTFFTAKGEKVHWKVLEAVKKCFIIVT
jgi:uncharacterized cupin superfamily protein